MDHPATDVVATHQVDGGVESTRGGKPTDAISKQDKACVCCMCMCACVVCASVWLCVCVWCVHVCGMCMCMHEQSMIHILLSKDRVDQDLFQSILGLGVYLVSYPGSSPC